MASSSILRYFGLMVLFLTLRVIFTEAKLSGASKSKIGGLDSDSENKLFIVYMGGVSAKTTNANSWAHTTILSQVLGSVEAAQGSILYDYTFSFNGFSAVFTDSHADLLRGMDEVISVIPSASLSIHTSHSWEFLGLSTTQGLWPQSGFGNSSVIIGMLDTGIWPESQSFNDDGFSPIPSSWKGECVKSDQFGPENCNKKLIGGKFFSKAYEATFGNITRPEFRSARDDLGHGTHTASTAAGRQVSNASFLGVGNGTISGGAPGARVAAYRVCWAASCQSPDILAGFDEAIKDGVDLISFSIGGRPLDYKEDSIAIGAFHAVERGILVSASAGNTGPELGTVTNVAPWIFTVGASTINRQFIATLRLGNGTVIQAIGINTFSSNKTTYPLVYGPYIAAGVNETTAAKTCQPGSLDKQKAEGTIVMCYGGLTNAGARLLYLQSIGVVGLVLVESDQTVQFPLTISSTSVNQVQADQILTYINSTENAVAFIDVSYPDFNTPAPLVPYFTAPGPNSVTLAILKPDITAPGVDIIASFSPVANPSELTGDTRSSDFNILSGTSMSCPHVTGAAALIKSVHPDWSPAAIKSALMTTAIPFNETNSNTVLASGAGELNLTKAADPGLVYDMGTKDYVDFLCSIGYNSTVVRKVTGNKRNKCPTTPPQTVDLNYPSIMFVAPYNSSNTTTITRTLTNVGSAPANYQVSVVIPDTVTVAVSPTNLTFASVNAKQSFGVHFSVQNASMTNFVFGSITWSDSNGHAVRIPIGVAPSDALGE